MPRTRHRPVEDFNAVFLAISKQTREPIVLVGGHAVNVWALAYKDRLADALSPLLPLTSGDMDVYATRNVLLALHQELGGKLLLSGPREITDGTLILGTEPDTREIDVLRSVGGIPKIKAQDTIPLEVCGHLVPVLFPHLLLQAKLHNARHFDQRDRQDVKHVKILIMVLREFLTEVITTTTTANQKPVLVLLQRSLAVVTSKDARAFARQNKLVCADAMPVAALTASPLPRLAAFAQQQLSRQIAALVEREAPGIGPSLRP